MICCCRAHQMRAVIRCYRAKRITSSANTTHISLIGASILYLSFSLWTLIFCSCLMCHVECVKGLYICDPAVDVHPDPNTGRVSRTLHICHRIYLTIYSACTLEHTNTPHTQWEMFSSHDHRMCLRSAQQMHTSVNHPAAGCGLCNGSIFSVCI